MSGPKFRLILAAAAFFGWLGWLAFLSFNSSRVMVVSRSQMMFATHVARAKITVDQGTPNQIELLDLIASDPQRDQPAAGEKIDPTDLPLTLLPFQQRVTESAIYLVPVARQGDRITMVAPPARFDREVGSTRFLIYPNTPEVLQQMRELLPTAK